MKLNLLQNGKKFRYKGYEFTKLADEKKSCYCLLNETVFESKFGETNDWAKSPIRKRLNKFENAGNSFVLPKINKDDLVAVSLNYRSYNNPNGRTTDRITILSYDEWLCWDIPPINDSAWLRSGSSSSARGASRLNTSGVNLSNNVYRGYAARPALHFRKDLEVEV